MLNTVTTIALKKRGCFKMWVKLIYVDLEDERKPLVTQYRRFSFLEWLYFYFFSCKVTLKKKIRIIDVEIGTEPPKQGL